MSKEGGAKRSNTKVAEELQWSIQPVTGKVIPLLLLEDSDVEEEDKRENVEEMNEETNPDTRELTNEELQTAKELAKSVENKLKSNNSG